jgi:hypothetical protein
MRNLKTLGLALVAVFAMSAVAASAAQAEFTVGANATRVTATQPAGVLNIFQITAGNAECEEASAEGATTAGTHADLTFTTLTFDKCSCLGRACDVIVNGCTFTLTTSGESHLCPTGGSITLTLTSSPGVSLCTIHVTAHTVNGITLDNIAGTPNDILATIHATNLTYETIGGGGKCGTQNTTFTCGHFDGEVTIQAFNGAGTTNPVSLTHD